MKSANVWRVLSRSSQQMFLAALVAAGTLFAATEDGPKKYRRTSSVDILANSMLVTKEPNKTGLKPGVHLIYVNPAGLNRLKQGGSTKYPEGTVFVDDVRAFSMDDGAYQQGARKFLTVMVKDSKKYGSTGVMGVPGVARAAIRLSRSSTTRRNNASAVMSPKKPTTMCSRLIFNSGRLSRAGGRGERLRRPRRIFSAPSPTKVLAERDHAQPLVPAQDVTLRELSVESFFPADDATERHARTRAATGD